MKKYQRLTFIEREDISRMIASGISLRKIASHLYRSTSLLSNFQCSDFLATSQKIRGQFINDFRTFLISEETENHVEKPASLS